MFVGENQRALRVRVGRGFRLGLLATALWIPNASAADSLTDAFVKAYQTNPQLLSERANLRATDENVAQAIALWRPTVTISADYSRIKSESKTDPATTSTEIKSRPWGADIVARQTLFSGGRILAQRRQADASVRAGRAILHATEQNVFFDTVSSYMNVVRDEAVLNLNNQNVELLKKQLEAA